MNVVDFILLGAVIVFALIGWRRGFVAGLFSFAGFFGAGLIASLILPRLLDGLGWSPVVRGIVMGLLILAASFAGQFVAGILGDRISDSLTWRPARALDHFGGAVLNVLVLAVVTWLVAGVAGYLPSSSVTREISDSTMVSGIQSLVPPETKTIFDGLQGVLQTTSVPTLFAGLDAFVGPDVAPPDASAETHAVVDAASSVVRVYGDAADCERQVSGSGFVIAPHRIVTNAHVVAGLDKVTVQQQRAIFGLDATVVYFDPKEDIAVLNVPDLTAPPLDLEPDGASTGDSAVIAGFPHSGPFRLTPVRVRTLVRAQANDIYGDANGVVRDIYLVRGSVQKGYSGGPMLSEAGSVLGIVFGADAEQSTTGYVIAESDLETALRSASTAEEPVDTGSCHIRD